MSEQTKDKGRNPFMNTISIKKWKLNAETRRALRRLMSNRKREANG